MWAVAPQPVPVSFAFITIELGTSSSLFLDRSPLPVKCFSAVAREPLDSGVCTEKVRRSAARTPEAHQSTYPTTPEHRDHMPQPHTAPDRSSPPITVAGGHPRSHAAGAADRTTLSRSGCRSKLAASPSQLRRWMEAKNGTHLGVLEPLGRRARSLGASEPEGDWSSTWRGSCR